MYRSIYDDSMWLVNLTENLLSITRIENGTLPLRRDAEMIGDIFHEALSHVDRRAAEHEIRVELEDDMLMANMDARLIVQVIINIVNNAVKYTPEGSDICLSAKRKTAWSASKLLTTARAYPTKPNNGCLICSIQ